MNVNNAVVIAKFGFDLMFDKTVTELRESLCA